MGEAEVTKAREDALRARILKAVRDEPVPPVRSTVAAWNTAVVVGSFAVAFAVFWAAGNVREWHAPPADGPARPLALMAFTVLASSTIAAVALRTAWSRAGSMLGASRIALLAVVVAAPLALFLTKVGASIAYDSSDWWSNRPGLKCFELSSVIGVALLSGLTFTRKGTELVHPHTTGAALGVAAGAIAAVLADLWCPVGHPLHVLFGHVLPMIMFGVLGAGPGGLIVSWRPK